MKEGEQGSHVRIRRQVHAIRCMLSYGEISPGCIE
jgi:hypothetical protein